MEDASQAQVEMILDRQKEFFASNQTKRIEFRREALIRLKEAIRKHEKRITDALWTDLHKSYEEAYLTEISIVNQEIANHLRNLPDWSRPAAVPTPLHLLPSSGKILHEPLGISLIIAPWNYPFQLLINPLVGAISSGCCAILKPSPYTPNVAAAMEEMIRNTFPEEYLAVVQGGREVNAMLLGERFDFIFFTGSPALGKVVMKAASDHLTPVVLELGGKSPCIVDKGANLKVAARRIVWGKTINAGQTCIAPDYLFVQNSVREELIGLMGAEIRRMFGDDIRSSRYFPRIVNRQAFDRLVTYLKEGVVRFGGETDETERYIAPTIIDQVEPHFAVMQDEIFGPILPVLSFTEIEEALDYVNSQEKPLAFYYFGKNRKAGEVLGRTTSGGACINDTLMHITNHHLPFGGVGNSGLGKYHGHDSFLAFSNRRSVVRTPTWFDLPVKYVPFRFFSLIKRIL